MEVDKPPHDTITDLWLSDTVLASSWDKSVHVYRNNLHCESIPYPDPILRCMMYNSRVVAGDINGMVYCGEPIQTPCGGIQCLHAFGSSLVVGGWARKICIVADAVEHTLDTGKVVCSDLDENSLIVGLASHEVVIYDLRELRPVHTKKFAFMIRSVKIAPLFYAVGSTCGMVSLHSYEGKWVFTAHSDILDGVKYFYPVNTLCFDTLLYTGGGDGHVKTWNLKTRKEKEVHRWKNNVSAMRVTDDRMLVAHSSVHDPVNVSNVNAIFILPK